MYDFSNRAILVTGSTRGIGRAIAELLGSYGAMLGINGRDRKRTDTVCEELAGRGIRVVPVPCDLSKPDAGAEAVRAFSTAAGRLDGLVNNAGGGRALAFRALNEQTWNDTLQLNLTAAMSASRQAYTIMREQKDGAIVNIASLAAHGPGKWMGADYAASKAGLVSLTKSLAFEAARFRIRVNAISPGMVETDMTAVLPPDMRTSLNIPLGRLAQPSEIASVAAFLLSGLSDYITGQVLHVDGGLFM